MRAAIRAGRGHMISLQGLTTSILRLSYALRHYPGQVAILATGCLAYHAYTHDGMIWPGMRIVLETDASEQLRRVEIDQAVYSKASLLIVAQTDRIINDTLNRLLSDVPGAVRVRLALVHDGTFTLAAQHMMHFSVTHAASAPGQTPGPLSQNIPLSQWSDYLTVLLNDKCIMLRTDQLTDLSARGRLTELRVDAFAACPVWDQRGMFLGSLFMSWDLQPAKQREPALFERMRVSAAQIGAALSVKQTTASAR